MKESFLQRLLPKRRQKKSYLQSVSGSLYRISDIRGDISYQDIKTQIDTMRALARDSQISTALSYYATDATTANSSGQIIWATANDSKYKDVENIINKLFERWDVNAYARDHILELATIGNLYLPTTDFYREDSDTFRREGVALDNNTIPDNDYDIIPSTKIPPEDILHLWYAGSPEGYICQVDENNYSALKLPETAVIHFSLGGMLGDYTIETRSAANEELTYDIKFAQPLMEQATQPTQTLNLLENALLLSSLTRVVKFINVDCKGSEEEEIRQALIEVKDAIEQQLAINTSTGDAQSFLNPQSPNNLIYLPKVNGNDPISVTDLNMAEANEQDSKLLQYYQDKKLSVLGVPKEAMNFSSNEGLGGAGAVMSQRSALYANSLQRLETAYMAGWKDAIDKYFAARNLSPFIGTYTLHMNPIITQQSTINFDRRDAALSQAVNLVDILNSMKVTDKDAYLDALVEILSEVFPKMGADAKTWKINPSNEDTGGGGTDEF